MKVKLLELTVGEVSKGYIDMQEEGVYAFDQKLNIRPKYQREFIYKDSQRDEVIRTINKGFPLNVMYWVKNGKDSFEILDGQQRTISFCSYVKGDYSIDNRAFHNLTTEEKQIILDYKLMIYVCVGTEKEKLDWFKIINIAGEKLSDQELRNAVYTGSWLIKAKSIFSKSNCPAYQIGKKYLNGSVIRQEYLETALSWISEGNIESYMSKHQHDENADELWIYFQNVIEWIEKNFYEYNKFMKGINWGELYNKYFDTLIDPDTMAEKIKELIVDEEIGNKKGIYQYVFDGKERHLSLRTFSDNVKYETYIKQDQKCKICGEVFEYNEMHGDHWDPWSKGGKTIPDNCVMLCRECNLRKSSS